MDGVVARQNEPLIMMWSSEDLMCCLHQRHRTRPTRPDGTSHDVSCPGPVREILGSGVVTH